MERREPSYALARDGQGYVAYRVDGSGPIDLVYLPGWNTSIDVGPEHQAFGRFLERIASFSRVIRLDRRGHGLSDPIDPGDTTLEQWMGDVETVMDAVGSERAAIFATSEAGPMAILWAATRPERTSALVLVNTWATGLRHPDYPWGFPPHARETFIDNFERLLVGDPDALDFTNPDPMVRRLSQSMLRRSVSPRMGARLLRVVFEADVRHVLPSVKVPTLVMHRAEDRFYWAEHGRYLGKHIPGARYVELPGPEHHHWEGDQDAILDEVEEFLTGARPRHDFDRVLSTVLFTDIVGSTERAATLGDRRWREVLDTHDAEVVRQLERHNGTKVSAIGRGDGVLATFDGPARAVRCARSIVDAVQPLAIDVRAGVHTGEIERRGEDIGGIAVHIADRIAGGAGPGEVLVSRTVVDLVVGSGLCFADRGAHALKGVPGEWQLYAVER
jgi:pimeloyl-ACP methyl ester carboxylesterase